MEYDVRELEEGLEELRWRKGESPELAALSKKIERLKFYQKVAVQGAANAAGHIHFVIRSGVLESILNTCPGAHIREQAMQILEKGAKIDPEMDPWSLPDNIGQSGGDGVLAALEKGGAKQGMPGQDRPFGTVSEPLLSANPEQTVGKRRALTLWLVCAGAAATVGGSIAWRRFRRKA